jgi:hypothetical protein
MINDMINHMLCVRASGIQGACRPHHQRKGAGVNTGQLVHEIVLA